MGGKEKSKRFFDKFDADKDAVVTKEEFSKVAGQQPQRKAKKAKGERTKNNKDNDK